MAQSSPGSTSRCVTLRLRRTTHPPCSVHELRKGFARKLERGLLTFQAFDAQTVKAKGSILLEAGPQVGVHGAAVGEVLTAHYVSGLPSRSTILMWKDWTVENVWHFNASW